jgi:hypothetical protein
MCGYEMHKFVFHFVCKDTEVLELCKDFFYFFFRRWDTCGYENTAFQADGYNGLKGLTFITAWSATCGHTDPRGFEACGHVELPRGWVCGAFWSWRSEWGWWGFWGEGAMPRETPEAFHLHSPRIIPGGRERTDNENAGGVPSSACVPILWRWNTYGVRPVGCLLTPGRIRGLWRWNAYGVLRCGGEAMHVEAGRASPFV